ncbi:hypothetical protein M1293_03680 [Candidatus Parvarchaeota archaeon]|nr:hypothetical protein [Candidatus Parvarchaeota archaeon]
MVNLLSFGVSDIVTFVLIFAIVYGLLSRSKFFQKPDIPALIAVSIGILALVSSFFVYFIESFIPYVLATLVFIFMILLLLSTALVPQDAISNYLRRSAMLPLLVILIMFIFGLIAYGYAVSQVSPIVPSTSANVTTSVTSPPTTVNASTFPNDLTNGYVLSIITAPSVLSLLLTLGAMAIAVHFMTRERR